MAKNIHPVNAYVRAFTALTPDNVERLYDLVADDVSSLIPSMSFTASVDFVASLITCLKPALIRDLQSVMWHIRILPAICAGK